MNTETADDYTTTANGQVTGLNGSGDEGKVRKVTQKAHDAIDTIEQAIGTGSEKVMGFQQQYGELAREHIRVNPLAYVAGAFAIGYLFAKVTR